MHLRITYKTTFVPKTGWLSVAVNFDGNIIAKSDFKKTALESLEQVLEKE